MTATAAYREIVARLERSRESGSLRQRIDIDTWTPLVHKHHPYSHGIIDACAECQEPWPCTLIIEVLRSGVLSPDVDADSPESA